MAALYPVALIRWIYTHRLYLIPAGQDEKLCHPEGSFVLNIPWRRYTLKINKNNFFC